MAKSRKMGAVFSPPPRLPVGADYQFQVHHFRLFGNDAIAARDAARRFELTNHAFVEACVKFAIDNMEKE